MPDSQRKNTDAPQKARPYADPSRDTNFDIHIDQPGGPVPATVNPSTEKSKSSADEKPKGSPELSRASATDTRAKTAGITPTDDMRNMLNRMQDIDTSDEIDDAERPDNAKAPEVPVRLRAPVVRVSPFDPVKSPPDVIVPVPDVEIFPDVVIGIL